MDSEKKPSRESRYPLRLPADLYEKIQFLAEKNFHSVNAEMVRLLRVACDLEIQAMQVESGSPQNSL